MLMNYRIKMLYPPKFWDQLPYKVNGLSFKDVIRRNERMGEELNNEGILTNITDEVALMAHLHGSSAREFRDLMRESLFSGDYDKVLSAVRKINIASSKTKARSPEAEPMADNDISKQNEKVA